ncbi:Rossmann-like and DUF2520 domain-containing protein [Arcanobacterium hippocoleae]|uniref:Short-subunit dehydrogenase-like oxidoreductase (DUF2520 family) n=1 Tax=Arcanobacterium hippocoleae TaxID=149017 RepID=A0ABU1T3I8_9ACTO|nr:DUF2520 domain-containing protein [Arcanobacterium hippocoleae]MDR6939874.1 putative short-subunit dehydrogenase-like oxidoreductase (DUF2520 family) [Arcanobacterium hippocoleae]
MKASGRIGIGLISAGKVGTALASALRGQGHSIIGAYARSEASQDRLDAMLPGVPSLSIEEIVERSELVLLAVPDDELAGVVSGIAQLGLWQAGQIVAHTAGHFGIEILRPAQEAGALCLAIHPAMTFTGTSLDVARLQGCPFAITALAPYQAIAHALVAEMGGFGVVISEEHRQAYHAALAHGANHLVTLVAQAMRMLAAIGVADPGMYLQALTTASLEGALSSADALQTGPVVRGDIGTLAGHLDVIEKLSREVPALQDLDSTYRVLAMATTRRACERRILHPNQAREINQLLGEEFDTAVFHNPNPDLHE